MANNDVQHLLDMLYEMIDGAKNAPLTSDKCILNRDEALDLLDEIRALLARGVSPRTTAMQAIGYKEFFDALEGRSTLSAAADLCKQRSRNYAKRQLTWFRRNPQLCWLRMTGQEDFAQILAAARQNIPFSAL